MDWLPVLRIMAILLVTAALIYFFAKRSPDAYADDGAPMPIGARRFLIGYLLFFGSLIVYLLVALNSVDLPEPTVLPELATSQTTGSSPTQNQNPGHNPTASSDKDAPILLEIFPNAALGSNPTVSLSLYGHNFQQQSVVRFNMRERTAKFVSDNLLKTQLEPNDMVSVGAVTVDVVNPGNRISNAIAVPIMKPRAPLNIFGWRPLITREVQLLLLAIFAGALGSYLHAIKSLADFIGNRTLTSSWFWWYIARPFLGMAMALVFYAVLRGGFLTGTPADTRVINSFGVIAVGALVGMFADKAAQKLGEIFETLFKSADVRSGKLIAPVIDKLDPDTVRLKEPTVLKIIGDRLGKVSRVRLNANERDPDTVSDKQVTLKLNQDDVAKPGEIKVTVVNPDGAVSPAATLHVTDLAVTAPSPVPSARVGTPYELIITATGGAAPYKWCLNNGPSWLTIDQSGVLNQSVLSGTPTAAGASNLLLTVTDSTGASMSKALDITVS